MVCELIPEENQEMNYIEYKTELLYQLGINDRIAVKAYLSRQCSNAPTEMKKRIKIDNAARTIMMNYYDGDRTFCIKRKGK